MPCPPSCFTNAEAKTGKLSVHLKCHSLPSKLENDYTLISHVLGEGMSGEVKLAFRSDQPNKHVAVKRLRATLGDARSLAKLSSEISIYLSMDHPHVTQLLDVYESQGGGFDIVMESMDGGSLGQRAALMGKTMQEKQVCDLSRQMLLAVSYVHSLGVIHRDLKADNFLFDTPGSWHLKLVDFGLGCTSTNERRTTMCGTAGYLAPDVLKKDYDSQCDMWSLGVIVFLLLSGGSMPFRIRENAQAQLEEVEEKGYVFEQERWWDVSLDAISFVQSLLQEDPEQRLTAQQALSHPWVEKGRQDLQLTDSTLQAFACFGELSLRQRVGFLAVALLFSHKESFVKNEEFMALDSDNDGLIQLSDIEELLVSRLQKSSSEAKTIAQKLNICGSGNLRYSTFMAAVFSSGVIVPPAFVQEAFQRFDKEGGCIPAVELDSFLMPCSGDDIYTECADDLVSYSEFASMFGAGAQEDPTKSNSDLGLLREDEERNYGRWDCRCLTHGIFRCAKAFL